MIDTKIDIDGLRKVVEAVRNAPEEEFDMDFWSCGACGTTACAIGWFCRLNPDDELKMRINKSVPLPHFSFHSGYEAVSLRFGITTNQALDLFYAECYLDRDDEGNLEDAKVEKAQVISRLESFIADAEGKP